MIENLQNAMLSNIILVLLKILKFGFSSCLELGLREWVHIQHK